MVWFAVVATQNEGGGHMVGGLSDQGAAAGLEARHDISLSWSSWRDRGSSICCLLSSLFTAKRGLLQAPLQILQGS